MLIEKRKIIFLFFFLLKFISLTKVRDELLIIDKIKIVEEKILEVKREFNIDIKIVTTSNFLSLTENLSSSKRSIFISIIKEKEKIKYSIFFSKNLISLDNEKEFDAILERELSYLMDSSDYFNFIYSTIGKIIDMYIISIK